MKCLVPLSVVASALACFVLARWAQAAPATGGVLGELTAESHTADRHRATSGARLFLVGFILWPRPARRP